MYEIPVATRPVQPIGSASKTAFAVISTVILGTGSIYGLDRADAWRKHMQPRVPFILDTEIFTLDSTERPEVRSASEHIENIRSVLNTSVVDLAAIFDVSRQSVYKWLAGSSTPEDEKLPLIISLSHIADAFHAAGVSRAGSLLKMKSFSGRSLMDIFRSGESCEGHITALINEAKAMENSYKLSGLASTKSSPTSDWRASFSIPGSSEHM